MTLNSSFQFNLGPFWFQERRGIPVLARETRCQFLSNYNRCSYL